jgi:hypothetical protein
MLVDYTGHRAEVLTRQAIAGERPGTTAVLLVAGAVLWVVAMLTARGC